MLDTRRIEAFLDTLRAERGAADNTIEAYRRDLEDASEFLRANRTSLVDAGERDLSAFVRDLHERGMSAATVSRRLSALRKQQIRIADPPERAPKWDVEAVL